MKENANRLIYEPIELFGKPALFTESRIDSDTLPFGIYTYELRESNEITGMPLTIDKQVFVNHAGTVLCSEPVDIESYYYRLSKGETLINFTGGEMLSLAQYCDQQKVNNFLFEYQMLDRLRQDCDYFLGCGNGSEKILWAGSVNAQIKKMRELYDILPEKPEWLSEEEINSYEKQMNEKIAPPKEKIKSEPETSDNLKSFYYTFGTSPMFPYKKGWVEIRANNREEADKVFRSHYPDLTPGYLNCSDVYSSKFFYLHLKGFPEDWKICHAKHSVLDKQSSFDERLSSAQSRADSQRRGDNKIENKTKEYML